MKRWRIFWGVFLCSCFMQCTSYKTKNPVIQIKTAFGEIDIELFEQQAPKTCAAILKNIELGIYERCSFYRVLNQDNQPSNATKSELIQGGIWKTAPQKANNLDFIPHESTQQTGLKHMNGTVSLARREPGTAKTEFFICMSEQPGLDHGGENMPDGEGYAAFGKVIKGMAVVKKIATQNESDEYFDPPVPIINIIRKQ